MEGRKVKKKLCEWLDLSICIFMFDGNNIDGFVFIILAKHLKARPTES